MYLPRWKALPKMPWVFASLLTHLLLILLCCNLSNSFDVTGTTNIRWLHLERSDWLHQFLVIRWNRADQTLPLCKGASTTRLKSPRGTKTLFGFFSMDWTLLGSEQGLSIWNHTFERKSLWNALYFRKVWRSNDPHLNYLVWRCPTIR